MTENASTPAPGTTPERPPLRYAHQMIPFQLLQVPREYQRPRRERLIKKIADNFNPDAFGALLVNQRPDHTYWVMDGQQRLAALDKMGYHDQNVPCIVTHKGGSVEEAETFIDANNRVALRPMEVFVSRLHAREGKALAIKQVVEGAGGSLDLAGNQHGMTSIQAVGAVESIFDTENGPRLLHLVIERAVKCFHGQRGGYSGKMLQGLAMFFSRYLDQITMAELDEKLARVPVASLMRQATLFQDVAGANPNGAVGRAIHHFYNLGKRTRRLTPWDDNRGVTITRKPQPGRAYRTPRDAARSAGFETNQYGLRRRTASDD